MQCAWQCDPASWPVWGWEERVVSLPEAACTVGLLLGPLSLCGVGWALERCERHTGICNIFFEFSVSWETPFNWSIDRLPRTESNLDESERVFWSWDL